MNKKQIIAIIISIFLVVILYFLGIKFYKKWQIEHAKIEVELIDNLEIDVFSKVKITDFIKSINGKIIGNKNINTNKIGQKEIKFYFINNENIKVPYKFYINIIDRIPPLIAQLNYYNVQKGYKGKIEKELFCGDNYDDKPICTIEGEYDLNKAGTYNLTFIGKDASNNESRKQFKLNVNEPRENNNSHTNNNISTERIVTKLEDVINEHKNSETKIGIDVSHWQGNIDYKKVKEAGIEFAFIRVGSQKGIDGEYYLDKKFERNIEGFNKIGIPVGIYFYSYANNKNAAKKEARWVISKIKKYDIELPIVFDWENWSFYQEFNKSFFNLTEIANEFLKEIEYNGYEGMLYSSKNYLQNVWFQTKYDVWLAHYTKKTNYEGKYKVWQICNNGLVPGIDDNVVDINIMYQN